MHDGQKEKKTFWKHIPDWIVTFKLLKYVECIGAFSSKTDATEHIGCGCVCAHISNCTAASAATEMAATSIPHVSVSTFLVAPGAFFIIIPLKNRHSMRKKRTVSIHIHTIPQKHPFAFDLFLENSFSDFFPLFNWNETNKSHYHREQLLDI